MSCNVFYDSLVRILGLKRTFKNINKTVPLFLNQMEIFSLFLVESEIYPVDWLSVSHCSLNVIYLTRDYFCRHFLVMISWNFFGWLFLIKWITILVSFWKVDPKLEIIGILIKTVWKLRMQDTFACNHQLNYSFF